MIRHYADMKLFTLLLFLLGCSPGRCWWVIRTSKSRKPPVATIVCAVPSEEKIRAGESGYSIMRQPVRWDTELDPTFTVPTSLSDREDDMGQKQLDDDWWASRVDKRSNGVTRYAASVQYGEVRSKPPSPISDADSDRQSLNLFQRSLDTLDYPRLLNALYDECSTAPARMVVEAAMHPGQDGRQSESTKTRQRQRELSFRPLNADTVQGCLERYQGVREMQFILEGGDGSVRLDDYTYRNRNGYKESLAGRYPPLGSNTFDLEKMISDVELKGKVLEGTEIRDISSMMDSMENIVLWSQGLQKVLGFEFVEIPKLVSRIEVNTTLHELLHRAFDKDGRLSGQTFPEIGLLRSRIRSLKADILALLDTIVTMPSIQSKLSLESGGPLYSEVSGGRLVVPISQKHASAVGIVHDTSRSGKTAYVEPTEIVGPTNELRSAEGELRAEEARIWRSLTAQIIHNKPSLERSVAAVGQLDLLLARLLLGRELKGVIPCVKGEGVINLKDAKHPVLVLLKKGEVVGSDVSLGLDGNQGLVLTGPNSGGKTVILKLLGLVALMARGGIPVPAEPKRESGSVGDVYHPRVDFFNPVLADIGDIQSVGGDLSTFSGHMLVCREVLANSGENSLVLMDELGSGTDPAQGVAIAQAILEALLEAGSRVAITTHYTQLKQLAASDPRFAVGGMQFVNGRPTYRLLQGTVGESFALAVAERLQLPPKIIERANELLDSETRQMGELIRELEDQKNVLDQQTIHLEQKRKEIFAMEEKLQDEMLRLERKLVSARRDEAKKFAAKLEEKERVLEQILEKLKSDPSRRVIAQSWDDIRYVKRDALNEAENIPSFVARKQERADTREETPLELVPLAELRDKPELNPGDSLIVCKNGPLFAREASVVRMLGSRVEVRVNNMNVSLKLSEVALPTGGSVSNTGKSLSGGNAAKSSISKAVEKALAVEMNGKQRSSDWDVSVSPTEKSRSTTTLSIRTDSNTVDVRGCNLETAKEKIMEKFSACLLMGRTVVYVLHGHGTGGVLKSKLRNWLKTERQRVVQWEPASLEDGGDAFTRVEIR